MTDLVIVLTTITEERADALASTLVNERLAACVNVHAPMRSTYRWRGAVESELERQLVIKTTKGKLAILEARLRELHPYDLPEFIVVAADAASDAYQGWVAENVT